MTSEYDYDYSWLPSGFTYIVADSILYASPTYDIEVPDNILLPQDYSVSLDLPSFLSSSPNNTNTTVSSDITVSLDLPPFLSSSPNNTNTTVSSDITVSLDLPSFLSFSPNNTNTTVSPVIANNFTSQQNVAINFVRRICGFPAFCNNSAIDVCSNTTTLNKCSECNVGYAALFATVCTILGLLILIGNFLVIWSVVKDVLKSRHNKIKASLAFADIFAAITLLVIVLYNFSWTIVSTPAYIEAIHLSLRGSKQAIVGGVFYLLGLTASLYHLVFLGLQRFYAIMWPLKYKYQTAQAFYIGLAMVWILSITTATSPLWFNGKVTIAYFSMVFIYLPSPENFDFGNRFSNTPSIIMAIIFTILPYLVMTILSIATAIILYYRFQKAKKTKNSRNSATKSIEKEIRAFKIVALMQIGFTITLAPVIIVNILFLMNYFRCDEIASPYTICLYLSMSNSLVNVLIYSARDKMFKKKVKGIFISSKSTSGVIPGTPNSTPKFLRVKTLS